MTAIQSKIGEGLKTGAFTPDQSQMYLSRLQEIRNDYDNLNGREVHREDWTGVNGRLDVLDANVTSALNRTAHVLPAYSNEDRIVMLQKRIDDRRVDGRLSGSDQRAFQDRLDSIRRDNMRMTEDGRTATYDDRAAISRRLDSLETDLNRTP